MLCYKDSLSSRKQTPSGRDKNVRNWSWLLTRMVLVSGHYRGVGDNNKYWYTKKYCGIKQILKDGTVKSLWRTAM